MQVAACSSNTHNRFYVLSTYCPYLLLRSNIYCLTMSIKHPPPRNKDVLSFRSFRNKLRKLLSIVTTLFDPSNLPQSPIASSPVPQRRRVKVPRAMAKTKFTPFQAYDLKRKHLHSITEGSGGRPAPSKIKTHRLVRREWAVAKPAKSKRSSPRQSKKAAIFAASLTAGSLLRCEDEETMCLHCGLPADDPNCSAKCQKEFLKTCDVSSKIDVSSPYSKLACVLLCDDFADLYASLRSRDLASSATEHIPNPTSP